VYKLFSTSERKYVFYTNYAGHPVVEILVDKPDRKGFDAFIEALRERISQIAISHHISKDGLQAGELKMLRRLSEKNILTSGEYEKAKAKIFGNKG
jgi:malic enzyme